MRDVPLFLPGDVDVSPTQTFAATNMRAERWQHIETVTVSHN